MVLESGLVGKTKAKDQSWSQKSGTKAEGQSRNQKPEQDKGTESVIAASRDPSSWTDNFLVSPPSLSSAVGPIRDLGALPVCPSEGDSLWCLGPQGQSLLMRVFPQSCWVVVWMCQLLSDQQASHPCS